MWERESGPQGPQAIVRGKRTGRTKSAPSRESRASSLADPTRCAWRTRPRRHPCREGGARLQSPDGPRTARGRTHTSAQITEPPCPTSLARPVPPVSLALPHQSRSLALSPIDRTILVTRHSRAARGRTSRGVPRRTKSREPRRRSEASRSCMVQRNAYIRRGARHGAHHVTHRQRFEEKAVPVEPNAVRSRKVWIEDEYCAKGGDMERHLRRAASRPIAAPFPGPYRNKGGTLRQPQRGLGCHVHAAPSETNAAPRPPSPE
jgi:hypothetical protein